MIFNIINSKFFTIACSIVSVIFSTFALIISSFNAYKYSESAFIHQINYEENVEDLKDQDEITKKANSAAIQSNFEDKTESSVEQKIKEDKDLNQNIKIINHQAEQDLNIKKSNINKKNLELNPKIVKKEKDLKKSTEKASHNKIGEGNKTINKSNFYIQLIAFANKGDATTFIQKSKFKNQLSLNKVLINGADFYQVLLNDKSFISEKEVKQFCSQNSIKNYLIKKSSK